MICAPTSCARLRSCGTGSIATACPARLRVRGERVCPGGCCAHRQQMLGSSISLERAARASTAMDAVMAVSLVADPPGGASSSSLPPPPPHISAARSPHSICRLYQNTAGGLGGGALFYDSCSSLDPAECPLRGRFTSAVATSMICTVPLLHPAATV